MTYQMPYQQNYANDINLSRCIAAIVDQYQLGSCVANALQYVTDGLSIEAGQAAFHFSRLGEYQATVAAEGVPLKDIGSIPSYALDVLKNQGMFAESVWAYDTSKMGTPAPASCYSTPMPKISGYTSLNCDVNNSSFLHEFQGALSQGKMISMQFDVPQWFMAGYDRYIPGVNTNASIGGHELDITHVSVRTDGTWYAEGPNSWGAGWHTAATSGDPPVPPGFWRMDGSFFGPHPIDGVQSVGVQSLYTIDGWNGIDTAITPERNTALNAGILALGRAMDTGGAIWWEGQVKAGATLAQLIDGMMGSAEFHNNNPTVNTATAVTEFAYHALLNRDADPGALSAWVGALNAGFSAGTLISETFSFIMNGGSGGNSIMTGHSDTPEIAAAQAVLSGRLTYSQEETFSRQGQDLAVSHQAVLTITSDPNSVVQAELIGINTHAMQHVQIHG